MRWLTAPFRYLELGMGWLIVRGFGFCPRCHSDDMHPTVHPSNCDVCRGWQPKSQMCVPDEIWQRYRALVLGPERE